MREKVKIHYSDGFKEFSPYTCSINLCYYYIIESKCVLK